jgi:hypothetical protein
MACKRTDTVTLYESPVTIPAPKTGTQQTQEDSEASLLLVGPMYELANICITKFVAMCSAAEDYKQSLQP